MTLIALLAACVYTGWCAISRTSDRAAIALLGSYAASLEDALRTAGLDEEADAIAAAHDLQHEGTNT